MLSSLFSESWWRHNVVSEAQLLCGQGENFAFLLFYSLQNAYQHFMNYFKLNISCSLFLILIFFVFLMRRSAIPPSCHTPLFCRTSASIFVKTFDIFHVFFLQLYWTTVCRCKGGVLTYLRKVIALYYTWTELTMAENWPKYLFSDLALWFWISITFHFQPSRSVLHTIPYHTNHIPTIWPYSSNFNFKPI